jgi:hypothetical protein
MTVIINRTPWIDDDGTGTTGTVLNNAMKTGLYNEIDGGFAKLLADPGAWVPIPFNAANFTSDSGTWTVAAGNVSNLGYLVIGKLMLLGFSISGTTVAGAPVFLRIKLPTGFSGSASPYAPNPFWYQQGAAAWALGVNNAASGLYLGLLTSPLGTAWAAGGVSVQGTGIIPLA